MGPTPFKFEISLIKFNNGEEKQLFKVGTATSLWKS